MKLQVSLIGLAAFLLLGVFGYLTAAPAPAEEAAINDKVLICHALPQYSDGTTENWVGVTLAEGRQLGVWIYVSVRAQPAHERHGDRVFAGTADREAEILADGIGGTCAVTN